MKNLQIPQEVSVQDLEVNGFSLSPSMYQRVEIPSPKTSLVGDLLLGYDKGYDPGSIHYIDKSTHYFIRTKSLQAHSNLLYPKGDSIVPINPKVFVDLQLTDGDILLSKDSNIGECAVIDGSQWQNHMLSGGVVRLRPKINPYYLFSFLKHSLFKTELYSMVPRGSTIAHAKEYWLNCHIPFPNQVDSERITTYVASLMEAIIDKEKAIKARDRAILEMIDSELSKNCLHNPFSFEYPELKDIRKLGRLDAAIYDAEYKSKIYRVKNYHLGTSKPSELGFDVIPGPSLEIKLLRTRLDSDTYKNGFYTLYIPANISEYGTMAAVTWLGTARKLPLLRPGDILFGEAGFHKGRSIVFIDEPMRGTTNAHGLYARRKDGNLQKSIFFRCIFNWYRSQRLIDLMAVGGSGGHFSPNYFDSILVPNFPHELQILISQQYHNTGSKPAKKLALSNFVDWHREWNKTLGIFELDRELKMLQKILGQVQKQIIDGKQVGIPKVIQ